MNKKILFCFSLFLTLFFADTLTFTGTAEIEDFDVEAARNRACIEALIQAAQHIKADLSGVNTNQAYEAVYEAVVTRTHGALKDIIFVKEIQLDAYFIAKIQCTIDESKLDKTGKVLPPDLTKVNQIEMPAAGPILEATEKIAKKLIQLFKTRQQADKPYKIALFPFGNQRGQRTEETFGYCDILYGRLFRLLSQDPSITLLTPAQVEALSKKHEILLDSFEKPGAHILVRKMEVDAVLLGRLDLFNFQDYKIADYFPLQLQVYFQESGKELSLYAEIRAEDKSYIGGARIFTEKDARYNLNRIRNLYNNQNFSFDILSNNAPMKKFYIDNPSNPYVGYHFIHAPTLQAFQIRVSNKIYDKKTRRSAVSILVDGKDPFFAEIEGQKITLPNHPSEVSERFLLEKEFVLAGWKQAPAGQENFMFQDQSETLLLNRMSVTTVPGSITIFIYSEILSSDQEGIAETLMKDGEAIDAKIPGMPMKIYPTPIAIFKVFYRNTDQFQILRNQGVVSKWHQLGIASYEKQTATIEQNKSRYRDVAEIARKKAQKQLVDFFRENGIQFKYLKRKKNDFECIENQEIFVRVDYSILELKEILEPFNDRVKLQNFLNLFEEGIQSWASESLK